MRLKSIHVDGFKSYATPTTIGEFDPSFNAITGLNGSGKSNILDAICFAMGITTLSSVRVANLQELIYKQGTAGITKASVTLTFDNSDRSQSPTGYEADREIAVTRQISVSNPTKYMINGRKALATEVSNMFRSVQLNVNNPHFLIMQGRITKVLNMKPEEIRDMLQEALGTLMYETKKVEAQKKMAQKEIKVQAIRETLDKQITPRIEKLREDKKDYDRYNAVVQDLQRHKRFILAYEFFSKQEVSRMGRDEMISLADAVEVQRTARKALAQEEKSALGKLDDKRRKREAEANGPLKHAVDEEKAQSQALVRAAAGRDGAQEESRTEAAGVTAGETRSEELTALLAKGENDSVEACKQAEEAQAAVFLHRGLAEKARQGVESAETGSSDMLQEELLSAQKTEQEQGTTHKMSQMTIKSKSEERKKLAMDYDKAAQEETSAQEMTEMEHSVALVKTKLDAMDEVALPAAGLSAEELMLRIKPLRSACASYTVFKFDPGCLAATGGKCFGRLATLIRLRSDLAESHARAMEVVAGAKVFQVVVDSKETGGLVLKHGKLAQRTTLIPLNAVTVRELDAGRVQYAAQKAASLGGWSKLALDVCDKSVTQSEVWPAMRFAFGSTLVCDSSATAKALAFDDKVRAKCVTLEGDVFDPSGTLTGGSRGVAGGPAPLFELDTLRTLEGALQATRAAETRRSELETERVTLQRELSQKKHELELLMARNAEAKSSQLKLRLTAVEQELEAAEAEKKSSEAALKMAKARIVELKDSMQNSERGKKKLVDEAKKAEQSAKLALKAAEEASLSALKRVEEVESARTQARDELDTLTGTLRTQRGAMEALVLKVSSLEAEYEACQTKYQQARAMREELDRSFRVFDSQIAELEQQAAKASDSARKLDLEIKQQEARQVKLKTDVKVADEMMAGMKKEHVWMEKEMQFFGKAHTEYDFELKNPEEIARKYRELETVQANLSRSINKKALAMMEKSEEEYDSLDRKRRTIESDRIAIERVISGLDRKKNEALVSAYEKVNGDFGSIFSTLLPGARAELRPVEEGTVLDGLEVRVAFGETWKDSLAELSGGQRSLLALSLVLALLRFKPAPLYILDEIDAALDLSHTQNIGVMLRTHFSSSQFIVVSLKEGMFANASCLFRTRFVDGVSTVTRTVNRAFQGGAAVTDKELLVKSRKRAVEEEEAENADG